MSLKPMILASAALTLVSLPVASAQLPAPQPAAAPQDGIVSDLISSMTATEWAVKKQREAVAAFAQDRYTEIGKLKTKIDKLETDAATANGNWRVWAAQYIAGVTARIDKLRADAKKPLSFTPRPGSPKAP